MEDDIFWNYFKIKTAAKQVTAVFLLKLFLIFSLSIFLLIFWIFHSSNASTFFPRSLYDIILFNKNANTATTGTPINIPTTPK